MKTKDHFLKTIACEWKIGFLIDYIVNVHHAYVSKVLPGLEAGLAKLAGEQHEQYPGLNDILGTFRKVSASLITHNRLEEESIFPYIKQLENAYRRKEPYGGLFVRTLRKPLSDIQKDHENITGEMEKLRRKAGKYIPPATADAGYRAIFRKLEEFDSDFVQHTYLEHEVLFPMAEEIEQELLRL